MEQDLHLPPYRYKEAIDYYVIPLEPIKAISDYLCYTKYRSLEPPNAIWR